jgi:hypothetical protein
MSHARFIHTNGYFWPREDLISTFFRHVFSCGDQAVFDEAYDWARENFGKPFYDEDEDISEHRWMSAKPHLYVRTADDAFSFRMRWC